MADEWQRTRLGDLVEIKHGWPFKSEFCRVGYSGRPIVVNIGNFRYDGGFRFDETVVREYCGDYPREYELQADDILLIMTCQTPDGEILGIPGRVPSDERTYLHNQRMGRVVIRSKNAIDPSFLYWLFLWKDFNSELVASATGTKIVHTAPSRIESFYFERPSLSEQRAIASVLNVINDKIAIESKIAHMLETMASTLFKSWFVDFDPVVAKAENRKPFAMNETTAALFPSTFVDSQIGLIPAGWRVEDIRSVVEDIYDGPHATPPAAACGAVFLGIRNFTGTQLDLSDIRYIAEEDWAEWTRRVTPRALDIVFTYEATLGFFALIPPRLRCCLGRRTALVRPRQDDFMPHFLFHSFVSPDFQEMLLSRANTGSTVDRIPLTDFPSYKILWPDESVRQRFEQIAAQLWTRIHHNQAQITVLGQMRDTLLPKLISGEIRLKDAEKIVGEAT